MRNVRLILVGGFLGAGKTTLLHQAAGRLALAGRRVGLITNDQAPDLVDTAWLARDQAVREVAGSCFCCNFTALVEAADGLHRDVGADTLIAEPVGSCTDLSATILQPLKLKYANEFQLAPLSVLVDPDRLEDVLAPAPADLHPSAAYIVRKQMEEADILLLNKVDTLSPERQSHLANLLSERFTDAAVMHLSALTGQGVDAWLAAIQTGRVRPGARLAEVDYDTYAQGEQVLGWLNVSANLSSRTPRAHWDRLVERLMTGLREAFAGRRAAVGHVKLLLAAGPQSLASNLTRTSGAIATRGAVCECQTDAQLTLNARVEMSPADLERIVRAELAAAAQAADTEATIAELSCLSPGRPNPTHRLDRVV